MFGRSPVDAGVLFGLVRLDLRTEHAIALLLRQDRLLLGDPLALPGELAALAAVALDDRPGQRDRDTGDQQQPGPVGTGEGERSG